MSEAPSPPFLCCYLVWLSEARPRQCSSVPVQHAVSQRLQVTAPGWSWNGVQQTTVNRLHQLWTLRRNVTSQCNCQCACCGKMLLLWLLPNVSIISQLMYLRVFSGTAPWCPDTGDSPAPWCMSRLMNSMAPSCGVLLSSRYSTCFPPGRNLKAW